MKRAAFVGRYSPMHLGHEWLIRQKLDMGIPCLILVRDTEIDDDNPFTADERKEMIEATFAGEDVEVQVIMDVESLNYGRGVGYEVNEFKPPSDIKWISATKIRQSIKEGGTDWESFVDPRTAAWLKTYYSTKD